MGAGIAKLLASEAGRCCVENGLRIDGGFGYSKEYEVERCTATAPAPDRRANIRNLANGDRPQAAPAAQKQIQGRAC